VEVIEYYNTEESISHQQNLNTWSKNDLFFKSIKGETETSASLDDASSWKIFTRIYRFAW
jgi:ABC-type maltose transport system permease subunit